MKTRHIFYTLLLLGMISFVSCKDDDHGPVLTNIQASTLDPIAAGPNFVLQEPVKGTNPLLFTVTWTETTFFLDGSSSAMPAGPITYTLQMDKAGNNFASPYVIAAAQDPYADIYVEDMNNILLNQLNLPALEPVNMELRIIASYGLNNPEYVVTSTNKEAITLTPYEPTVGDVIDVFMIGNMNGWDNNNTDFWMYRDDSDPNSGVYVWTGLFKNQDDGSNCYFKFASRENLGDWNKMYVDGGNGKLVLGGDNDGAAFDVKEGYYTVTLDIKNMTYSIAAYDASSAVTWDVINFVGAFCDWGEKNEPDMVRSSYDPHQWSLVIDLDNIEYGVKFRANHSWGDRWCPSDPNAQPYGKAEYNPAGHDNNIDLSKQGLGKYHVRFNDLTGQYIVMHD